MRHSLHLVAPAAEFCKATRKISAWLLRFDFDFVCACKCVSFHTLWAEYARQQWGSQLWVLRIWGAECHHWSAQNLKVASGFWEICGPLSWRSSCPISSSTGKFLAESFLNSRTPPVDEVKHEWVLFVLLLSIFVACYFAIGFLLRRGGGNLVLDVVQKISRRSTYDSIS
jgi:hypothetical protein